MQTPAAEPELPDDVRQALMQVGKDLDPVFMSWSSRYDPSPPILDVVAKVNTRMNTPFASFDRPLPTRVARLSGKCFYDSEEFQGHMIDSAFDGVKVYRRPKLDSNGRVLKWLDKHALAAAASDPKRKWGRYFSNDYPRAAGVHLPALILDLSEGKGLRSLVLALLDQKGHVQAIDRVAVNGENLLHLTIVAETPTLRMSEGVDLVENERRIRASSWTDDQKEEEVEAWRQMRKLPHERVFEFYLDPNMNYAVRRHTERHPDGTLLLDVINDKFEQIKGRSTWLPRTCRIDYYSWPSPPGRVYDKPSMIRYLELTEIEVEHVEDNALVRNFAPAMDARA